MLTGRFGLSRFKSHADCCSPEVLLGLLRRTETDLHHSNAAFLPVSNAGMRHYCHVNRTRVDNNTSREASRRLLYNVL